MDAGAADAGMQLGPLALALRRKPGAQPVSAAQLPDTADYYRVLGALARTLAGQPWMVVAGCAVPLTLGRFYRRHQDLDIAVPVEALPRIAAALQHDGYTLTTRLLRTRAWRRIDLEIRLRVGPDSFWLRRVPRHLKFHAPASVGFAACIDLFPYVLTDNELLIPGERLCIPRRDPLQGAVRLPTGVEVAVEHLYYVGAVKSRRRHARDELDLRMMALAGVGVAGYPA